MTDLWRRGAALAALTLTVSACASVQERLTATENRLAALEAQVADLQAAQQNVITRLTQVRQDLEAALQPMRTAQADRGEDLRGLQTQVNVLRQELSLLQGRIDEVLRQLSSSTPAAGAPMPAAGGGRLGGAPPASESEALFDSAFRDYTEGAFVLAIDGFREFLSRYPDAPRVDEALYWMAESLAAQDDHGGARERFLELVREHPDSRMLRDAKLRAALEAIELGERDVGVGELRDLIATHAGTDQVMIACMQLRQLGERVPAGCPSPPLP